MSEETKKHITLLKNFFGEKVNSILEIQCGSGYDIENCIALQDSNLNYIGVDIIDEVIQDNRQYFRNEKNKLFMILDASNEPLPKSDLVICHGMVEYLPISNIWALLENIRDSEAKYLAFDFSHCDNNKLELNANITIEKKPKKRPINLSKAPFYFPSPKFLVPMDELNTSLGIYEIREISFFMDWHNDDISYLRSKLFYYLEEDFTKIREIFSKHEDGEKMFREAVSSEKIDWDKFYNKNETYQNIVDNNSIFTKYVDLLILIYKSGNIDRLHADMPDRYKELLTEDNFLNASIIAKDYVKWKYDELF